MKKQARADAELHEFLQDMAAQRFFLTLAEQRAARTLFQEGFESVEIAAFLQASPWAIFYRKCLSLHSLPESEAIRHSLRQSYERGDSVAVASEHALEALRREAHNGYAGVTEPTARPLPQDQATVEFEVELFGRRHCRAKYWPAWMLTLTGTSSRSGH